MAFCRDIPSHEKIPIPGIKIPKLRKIPNPLDKNPETRKSRIPEICKIPKNSPGYPEKINPDPRDF